MARQVTSDDFYNAIGPLDVVLEIKEPYPYKTLFKMRNGGKVVGYEDRDGKYYLNDTEE